MTGAEQRECPTCGTQFTWTTAAPRQRFCSTPCRHRWWDRTRRRGRADGRDDPRGHDPRGRAPRRPPAGDPRGHDNGAPGTSPGTTAAVPACPHCRQPVAIVAWLVPPAAASIDTPRHADHNP